MFEFCVCAACIPAHAAALKDRSLMPPVSVTMQACAALPPVPADPLAPVFLLAGGLPQPAAASTKPPTARAPTNLIPRTGRKTTSFSAAPHHRGIPTPGSVRLPADET